MIGEGRIPISEVSGPRARTALPAVSRSVLKGFPLFLLLLPIPYGRMLRAASPLRKVSTSAPMARRPSRVLERSSPVVEDTPQTLANGIAPNLILPISEL
jgi:hypothetical protein